MSEKLWTEGSESGNESNTEAEKNIYFIAFFWRENGDCLSVSFTFSQLIIYSTCFSESKFMVMITLVVLEHHTCNNIEKKKNIIYEKKDQASRNTVDKTQESS